MAGYIFGFLLLLHSSSVSAQSGWHLLTPPFDEEFFVVASSLFLYKKGRDIDVPGRIKALEKIERLHKKLDEINFDIMNPSEKMKTIIKETIIKDAPLNKWEQLQAFDSAQQCERERFRVMARLIRQTEKAERPSRPSDEGISSFSIEEIKVWEALIRIQLSKCVPSAIYYKTN